MNTLTLTSPSRARGKTAERWMKTATGAIMKASTSLPSNYSKYTLLEPSKDPKFTLGAIITAIVLLLLLGWLLVLFANALRPTALDGMRLGDLVHTNSEGSSFVIPPALFRNAGLALIGVLIFHELVHGLFYWFFSGRPPKFGFRGLFPYAAAPAGVYFPHTQFLAIGLAPLVLLTLFGLLLMAIAPIALVPFILFFVLFNASGAAGDLIMVVQLASFPSDTLMEDSDSGVAVYGPERN
jgi:hypothetical protein